jgi:molybdopterin-guanine dinucleotide biosynthesis protein B
MKIMQVVGYKNAGKTTLACEIVAMLSAEGLRVGTVKRDAHGADPEPEGADTRRFREAGAQMSVLTSAGRTLCVWEHPSTLEHWLGAMQSESLDAAIVEGFKMSPYPKLAILRSDEDLDLLGLEGLAGIALRGPCPEAETAAAEAGIPAFRTDGHRFAPLLAHVRRLLIE